MEMSLNDTAELLSKEPFFNIKISFITASKYGIVNKDIKNVFLRESGF